MQKQIKRIDKFISSSVPRGLHIPLGLILGFTLSFVLLTLIEAALH